MLVVALRLSYAHSATVAVLAIPSINGVVQLAAILSILCSIASVCLGSFLLWVNQSLMTNDSLVSVRRPPFFPLHIRL
jgi:hypothetical protein